MTDKNDIPKDKEYLRRNTENICYNPQKVDNFFKHPPKKRCNKWQSKMLVDFWVFCWGSNNSLDPNITIYPKRFAS